MSGYLLERFFPSTIHNIVKRFGISAYIYNHFIHKNPEIEVDIPVVGTVRNPCLLLAAVIGAALGLGFGYELRTAKESNGKPRYSNHIYWPSAFIGFGLMNVSGIVLHCLLPAPSDGQSYPAVHPHWWAMDTLMTGCSSSSLALASMNSIVAFEPSWRSRLPSFSTVRTFFIIYGFCAIVSFELPVRATFPLETWYIMPMLCAGPPVLWMMFMVDIDCAAVPRVVYACGAILIAIGANDRILYNLASYLGETLRLTHRLGYDLLSLKTLGFAGCDLAFWGMMLWIRAAVATHAKQK